MQTKSRGPGPPKVQSIFTITYFVSKVVFLLFINYGFQPIAAEKNKQYNMESLCKEFSSQPIYRKVDGAFLKSQNEKKLDCTVTFQTHSILQKFMLRFDSLQLDCNDQLYIYDGSHATGNHAHLLSCQNTHLAVGSISTQTNFVTLKYVTDNWGTDKNGFELVITAFKDAIHTCNDFICESYCIHQDLICDGISHCKDGKDENAVMCSSNEALLWGMTMPVLVTVGVITALIISACIVTIAIVKPLPCCSSNLQEQTPIHAVHHQVYSGSNGTNNMIEKMTTIAPAGTTVLGPMTENWAHPVALGYLVVWGRLYCHPESHTLALKVTSLVRRTSGSCRG